MNDHGVSLNAHCTCRQTQCPIWGNCVLCVQNHLSHKRHIPECIQEMLRPAIESLARQMEFKIEDARPDAAFWESFDKDAHMKRSIERHKSGA